MQYYDLFYIVPLSVTEEQVPEVLTAVQKIITDNGGKIIEEQNLGNQKLAYPIKHQRHGTYVQVDFDAEPKDVTEIDRKLRLNTEVLRFLITKRVVKSAEQMKKEADLQSRLKEKRREAYEKAKAAAQAEKRGVAKPDGKVKVKDLLTGKGDAIQKPDVVVQEKTDTQKPEVSLEELDEKLDKLLDDDMLK